jgi:cytochrome o ubiquinol oxidase subunit III
MSTHENSLKLNDKSVFGFWVYLMTDLILFGCLFATFAVLRNNTFGGPDGNELFSLPFVLTETMLLLTSSFTCGLAILALHQGNKGQVINWLVLTFILGAAFLGMEIYEFNKLVTEGESWRRSGFLTSFFTLVGTHGAHITAGLIWIGVMIMQLIKRGITTPVTRRLTMLSLFWHFLDIVWIFIFTIVYLYGAI